MEFQQQDSDALSKMSSGIIGNIMLTFMPNLALIAGVKYLRLACILGYGSCLK